MKVNREVPEELVRDIAGRIQAEMAFSMHL
jgi:hypothetical protein